MDERRKLSISAARQASLANTRPTAESLVNKLKKEQDVAWKRLKEKLDLAVELHAPSGMIIRMAWIGSYSDTNDTLRVVGTDVETDDECQAIVPVQSFCVIFRVREIETRKPERKPVGFYVAGAEGSE